MSFPSVVCSSLKEERVYADLSPYDHCYLSINSRVSPFNFIAGIFFKPHGACGLSSTPFNCTICGKLICTDITFSLGNTAMNSANEFCFTYQSIVSSPSRQLFFFPKLVVLPLSHRFSSLTNCTSSSETHLLGSSSPCLWTCF